MGPTLFTTERSFLVVFVVLISVSIAPAGAQVTCVKRDRDALLSFVDGLNDSAGQLSSWNKKASSDCCTTFVGVSCNAKGEVVNVTFEADLGSDDCDEDCPTLDSKNPGEDLIGKTLSKLLALQTLNLSYVTLRDPFPVGLSALKNLTTLSLRNLAFNGTISDDIGTIISLKYLSLNQIQGPLPDSLCQLTNLETLDFSQNLFSFNEEPGGPIPACIGNLRKLKYLLLEANGLTGALPESVAQLKALIQLKVTKNMLTGPIPSFLGRLSLLEELYLQGNNWTGTIPASLGSLSNMKELKIGRLGDSLSEDADSSNVYIDIIGTIPVTFAQLTSLETLVIRGTRITGAIPAFLGNLRLLSDLELDHNSLSGQIPPQLGGTNLTTLILDHNSLSGAIPFSLGNLEFLTTFVASNNLLTGSIPESFSSFSGSILDLSHNNLTGSIPDFEATLNYQSKLDLSYNKLTGSVSAQSIWSIRIVLLNNNLLTSLGDATVPSDADELNNLNIMALDVHSNNLQGPIPFWVFQVVDLFTLDLSDNQLTVIPAFTAGSGNSLSYVNFSKNSISGTISDEFTKLSGLNTIDLSKNKLSGSIPRNFSAGFPYLNNLILGENLLTGTIPSGVFESTFLNVVILNSNQLTGAIPPRSGNDFLNYVDLSDNQLSGIIPGSLFDNPTFLNVLKLSNNKLTGPIPDLQSCTGLQQFIVENNELTGSVAGPNLSMCTNLEVYDVSGNSLVGPVSPVFGELTALVVLDLSQNLLSGSLKGSLFDELSSLLVLDLSDNNLTGSVPWAQLSAGLTALTEEGAGNSTTSATISDFSAEDPFYSTGVGFETLGGAGIETGLLLVTPVYSLSSTAALDLSQNSFSGEVDPSIGELTELRSLNLANNSFSGPIPASIANISNLMNLQLENNDFSGQIPQGLQHFPSSDFEGNSLLCGPPLPLTCS